VAAHNSNQAKAVVDDLHCGSRVLQCSNFGIRPLRNEDAALPIILQDITLCFPSAGQAQA
jgi:hypothetical protein